MTDGPRRKPQSGQGSAVRGAMSSSRVCLLQAGGGGILARVVKGRVILLHTHNEGLAVGSFAVDCRREGKREVRLEVKV